MTIPGFVVLYVYHVHGECEQGREMMECLCGHHIAVDCPAHGPEVNRARIDDMLISADDWEEYHQWLNSVEE